MRPGRVVCGNTRFTACLSRDSTQKKMFCYFYAINLIILYLKFVIFYLFVVNYSDGSTNDYCYLCLYILHNYTCVRLSFDSKLVFTFVLTELIGAT